MADEAMTTIKIKVPHVISSLYDSEQEKFIMRSMRYYAKQRIKELEEEIKTAEDEIQKFKNRYKMDLKQYEQEVMKDTSIFEHHDDYNTWFYWSKVLERHKDSIKKFREYQEMTN